MTRPPFISKLTAEDRCHLNGLAMVDGQSTYVTAVSSAIALAKDAPTTQRIHSKAGRRVL